MLTIFVAAAKAFHNLKLKTSNSLKLVLSKTALAAPLGLAFVAWSVRFAFVPSTNNGRRVLNQEATS